MKKLTIGRSPDCDIRIKDDTDKISRRHAVLRISPFGKMIIYDTSGNGTFVNGKPVEKPNGTPVTRQDTVDLAHVKNLDWSLVGDPYRGMKLAVGIFLIVLVALGVLYFIYADTLFGNAEKHSKEPTVLVDSADKDTAVAAEADSIAAPAPARPAAKAAPKAKKNPGSKTQKSKDSLDNMKKPPMLPDMDKSKEAPNKKYKEGGNQELKPKDLSPSRGPRSMKQEKDR